MKKSPFVFGALLCALLVVLPTGCSKSSAANQPASASTPQPTIAEIAASYRSYKKITPTPMLVNPELAMACSSYNPQALAAARAANGPHALESILVYMNEAAAKTFASGGKSYAPGSVIVKQKGGDAEDRPGKHTPQPVNGVGGMVKRAPGFDPEHGDWEYFYFKDAAKIDAGRIVSCVECHKGAKKTDYVFGTWAERKKH